MVKLSEKEREMLLYALFLLRDSVMVSFSTFEYIMKEKPEEAWDDISKDKEEAMEYMLSIDELMRKLEDIPNEDSEGEELVKPIWK